MTDRAHTKHRGVDKRQSSLGATPEHRVSSPSEYCAICFLTFGSQERRFFRDGEAVHARCVRRLSRQEAA